MQTRHEALTATLEQGKRVRDIVNGWSIVTRWDGDEYMTSALNIETEEEYTWYNRSAPAAALKHAAQVTEAHAR